MSTESLHSSTSSSFTGDIDSYLDKIGSKAPQSWRKPRSRMYDYNRTLGNEYYQPMVDYIVTKENTGVYNTRKAVHLPVELELQQRRNESPDSQASNTSADLGDFLVRSYAKQIKERNATTAAVQNLSLRFSSRNQNSELNSRFTSTMLRDHYIRELRALKEGRRSSSFLV